MENLKLYVKKSLPVIVVAIIIGAILFSSILPSNANLRSESPINPDNIEDYMRQQVEIGPRYPGSDGALEFRNWIYDQIDDNWTITTQEFTHLGIEASNYWITSANNSEWPSIIIGAHFDSRKRATEDATNPDDPVPGANDGASGVAAILEMMDHIPQDIRNDFGFVLFDAEDQGSGGMDGWSYIIGSQYFASQMSEEQIRRTQLFLLYDMIANDDMTIEYEGYSNGTLSESIWDTAHELGYETIFKKESGPGLIDDHRPFLDLGIPSVDLIDFDYPEWHTVDDTMDNVSAENAAIVVDVVLYWIENVFYSEFYQENVSNLPSPSNSESDPNPSSPSNSVVSLSASKSVFVAILVFPVIIQLKKSSVSY